MKASLRQIAMRLGRRIGTAVGAAAATYLTLDPAMVARVEALVVMAVGVGVDLLLEHRSNQ